MQYYVREQQDKTALLIAEDGHPLSTFDCVDEAVATCIIECLVAPMWIEWHLEAKVEGIDRDRVYQALARHCQSIPAIGGVQAA